MNTIYNKIGSIAVGLWALFLLLMALWGGDIIIWIFVLVLSIGSFYLYKEQKLGKSISLIGILLSLFFVLRIVYDVLKENAIKPLESWEWGMTAFLFGIPAIYLLVVTFVVVKASPKLLTKKSN